MDKKENPRLDSCIIENGHFHFAGKVEGSTMANQIGPKHGENSLERPFVDLFLEPGNLTLTGRFDSLQKAVVRGSGTQDEYMELQRMLARSRRN